MNQKQSDYFDTAYVAGQQTVTPREERGSSLKGFLKSPIVPKDIEHYGTSQPRREIIRAVIEHGKG